MAAISREQWAVLEPLLDEVLELPSAARPAWLAALRVRAPEHADQVETLLAGESTGSGVLDSPLEVPPAPPESLEGHTIGHYTLVRAIGHGGMGTVWLGKRNDGRFEAEVAIKLLNLALIGRTGEERFTQEGNVLARLIHPHIARLLDAGVTGGGQPYLVLEYIDGIRIDQFVNQQRFTVEQRIALFLDVLDGVATAHANLVVHRDIKPSNIMVTQGGDVKLLDFGIAKLLTESQDAAGPSSITVHDGRALTPEYAAPEQVRGEPVSTATDVYSLGVLLYVLLGEKHPTGERCHTPVEHLRATLDTEPSRLSDAVVTTGSASREDLERIAAARGATPERLQRLFLGDLDNILAKALKKHPAERYQTVAAFADDLKRYLRNEPVSARSDSLAYRSRKFVRRNRAGVTAAAVAILSLLVGTTVTMRQLSVARKERDRAAQALRRSQASTAFESLIFRLIEPGGNPLTYQQLMDKGREVLDLHFQSDPLSRIQVYLQFAQNYLRQDQALPADTILRRAVAVADSMHDLQWQGRTRCDLALAYVKRDIADTSASLVREARTYLDRAADVDDDNASFCDSAEGEALMAAKKYDSAAVVFARVPDRIRAAGDTLGSAYSYTLNDYSRALFFARRIRAARPIALRIIEMVRAGSVVDPTGLAVAQYNAGAGFDVLGEYVARRDFLRRELSLTPKPNPTLLYDYATTTYVLEQPDTAAAWFALALARGDDLDPPRRCVAHLRLARIARRAGRPLEAEPHAKAAASACAPVAHAPSAASVAAAYTIEAPAFRSPVLGLSEWIAGVLDSAGYTPKATSRSLIEPLAAASRVLLDAGDYNGAGQYASEIVRIAQVDSITLKQSGAVGIGLLLHARVEVGAGHREAARDLAYRALPPLSFGLGSDHPLTKQARALADSLKAR